MCEESSDHEYKPFESCADRLVNLWLKGQKLLNAFWRIWQEEYLLGLRERAQVKLKSKKIVSAMEPSVGDIVIIKDELPRSCWRMGRIEETQRSKDGKVRSAEVRLATGRVIKRPVSLLYPLESTEYVKHTSGTNSDVNSTRPSRSTRIAAIKAKQAIKGQLQ
ncbi:uncharacterized protein LOC123561965 [Mercenaria mercenaria]|uniref:uncharacterized protein LOC123561965 n=1 Tax=Mercenaria mercenaria TaxID=6596 RepID=UPI00234EACD1|nr:uncharacterized protein LOC123561965 [Mercenaria mercenaria]